MDSKSQNGEKQNLELVLDVPVKVMVILGGKEVTIREILQLGPGSVIQLDRRADQPVDLYANNKLIARGEVVITGEQLGFRIVEIAGKGQ